jgi:GTP 3',8-cyclase
VATCLPFWDKPEFIYGNIYHQDFGEIWHGEKRKKIKDYLEHELDAGKCPPNCRPDAINGYLNEISNPSMSHVNFI